jgi:hypothetical protein
MNVVTQRLFSVLLAVSVLSSIANASHASLIGDTVEWNLPGPASAVVSDTALEFSNVSDPAFGGAFERRADFFADRMVLEWEILSPITLAPTGIVSQPLIFSSVDWPNSPGGITGLTVGPGNSISLNLSLLSPTSFKIDSYFILPGVDGIFESGEIFSATVRTLHRPAPQPRPNRPCGEGTQIAALVSG